MNPERKLKVGDWDPLNPDKAVKPTRASLTVDDSRTSATPASPQGSTQDSAPPASTSNPLVTLVFDPWRLVMALRRGMWLILSVALLGAAAGVTVGLFRVDVSYTVEVKLVKREIPSAMRAGRLGEAYQPPKLQPATLISAAGSYSAIRRVSERTGIPVAQLRGAYSFKEIRKTDLMLLTVTTDRGKEATASLANVWAEEIVDYTRELQARESRDVRTFLIDQVRRTEQRISEIEERLIKQVEETGTVNPEKEIEAYLRSLSGIELQQHNARIELETIEAKITALRNALRQQSPTAEKLRKHREAYKELLSQYTEENPLVIEAADTIRQLEEQLEEEQKRGHVSEEALTGTGISDALYLDLVELENRQRQLQHQEKEFKTLLEERREQMRKIPKEAMVFQQLNEEKQALLGAREMLASRLQEARLFGEKAPGYLRVLAPATPDEVSSSSPVVKIAAAGIGLAVLGGGLIIFLVLGWEVISKRLKTPTEMSYLFGPAPVGIVPPGGIDQMEAGERSLIWSRWMGNREPGPQLLWLPFPADGEDALWSWAMAESSRLVERVVLIDIADSPLTLGQDLKPLEGNQIPAEGQYYRSMPCASLSAKEAQEVLAQAHRLASARCLVWIRVSGALEEPLPLIFRGVKAVTILGDPARASRVQWMQQSQLFKNASQVTPRLIVLDQTPTIRVI